MGKDDQDQLRRVTRTFYDAAGGAFAQTRERPWAGWARVAASFGAGARVLDLGCGNGRFGTYLAGLDPARRPSAYLGIDQSPTMLKLARAAEPPPWARFDRADLLADGDVERACGAEAFDVVTLFAVLHHIPGQAMRRALLARALRRLAPGGLLAVTLWRFDESPRFSALRLPDAAFARLGIEGPREPGDHLLRFGGDGLPARYCHFPAAAHVAEYLALPDAELVARYRPDWGDTFNEYLLFRARP